MRKLLLAIVVLAAAAPADAVARGWVALADRASRLDLPDGGLAEAVVAARCDLMLEGPVDVEADPIGFVLDDRGIQQLLRKIGLWKAVESRLARGENVGQSYAMVASGNALFIMITPVS